MFFKPHTLQVKSPSVTYNSNGVPTASTASWETKSKCRCDKDSTQDLIDDHGQMYKASFHIVAEKATGIAEGSQIQCIDKSNNVVGSGIVRQMKVSNCFNLMELWV